MDRNWAWNGPEPELDKILVRDTRLPPTRSFVFLNFPENYKTKVKGQFQIHEFKAFLPLTCPKRTP